MAAGLVKTGRGEVLTDRLRGMCGRCGLKRARAVLRGFNQVGVATENGKIVR